MADAPVIGHVIIACMRCGEPRHVPVTCESVPLSRPNTYTWKVTRYGQQVGEMHLAFGTFPDHHQCPAGRPLTDRALTLIKSPGAALGAEAADPEGVREGGV